MWPSRPHSRLRRRRSGARARRRPRSRRAAGVVDSTWHSPPGSSSNLSPSISNPARPRWTKYSSSCRSWKCGTRTGRAPGRDRSRRTRSRRAPGAPCETHRRPARGANRGVAHLPCGGDEAVLEPSRSGAPVSASSDLNASTTCGIELRAGAALELPQRVLVREASAVHALGRHRVVGVATKRIRAPSGIGRRRGCSGSRRRPSARGGAAPRSRPARCRASRASGSRSGGAARARAARVRSAGPACGGSPRGSRAFRRRANCRPGGAAPTRSSRGRSAGRSARRAPRLPPSARRCRHRARQPRGPALPQQGTVHGDRLRSPKDVGRRSRGLGPVQARVALAAVLRVVQGVVGDADELAPVEAVIREGGDAGRHGQPFAVRERHIRDPVDHRLRDQQRLVLGSARGGAARTRRRRAGTPRRPAAAGSRPARAPGRRRGGRGGR